jgi:hypothetical protein
MNLAKSLIVSKKLFYSSEKTFSIIAHLCSEMAVFDRNFTFRLDRQFRYSTKKECYSFLLKESNYRPFRVCMGCTVNNLLKLWVCKLSFLKRHPSIQKIKILKYRAVLQWKKKNLIPAGTPRLTNQTIKRWRMLRMRGLSMESNCRPHSASFELYSCKFGRKLSI